MRKQYNIISTYNFPGELIAVLNRDVDQSGSVTYSMDLKHWHPKFIGHFKRNVLQLTDTEVFHFIQQRTYDENYEGLQIILDQFGMDHYDRWEMLLHMNCQCGYDDLAFDRNYLEEETAVGIRVPQTEPNGIEDRVRDILSSYFVIMTPGDIDDLNFSNMPKQIAIGDGVGIRHLLARLEPEHRNKFLESYKQSDGTMYLLDNDLTTFISNHVVTEKMLCIDNAIKVLDLDWDNPPRRIALQGVKLSDVLTMLQPDNLVKFTELYSIDKGTLFIQD